MRTLAIRQPWASLIIEGLKTVEIRSKPTIIRGRVAIYASATEYSRKHRDELSSFYTYMHENKVIDFNTYLLASKFIKYGETGCILGTVEIESCTKTPVTSKKRFEMEFNNHFAPTDYLKDGGVYFWYLKNPIKFDVPIPIKWPSTGSWAHIELPEEYK